MKVITVDIKKPLYGNYVYINGTIVNRAISSGAMLEIIVPAGRAIVDPRKWKENGRVMKKVFKYPDNPMILYGGNVPVPPSTKGRIINPEVEKKLAEQPKLF